MTRRKFDTNLCNFGIPSSGSRTDRYFKPTFTNFSQLEIYLKITLIYSYTKQSENRQTESQILSILTDKMSVTDITRYVRYSYKHTGSWVSTICIAVYTRSGSIRIPTDLPAPTIGLYRKLLSKFNEKSGEVLKP